MVTIFMIEIHYLIKAYVLYIDNVKIPKTFVPIRYVRRAVYIYVYRVHEQLPIVDVKVHVYEFLCEHVHVQLYMLYTFNSSVNACYTFETH